MTPDSPTLIEHQRRKPLGLPLLATWIVFFIWFAFVYASIAHQINEFKHLRQTLAEQVPMKNFDEFYKSISTDPRNYEKLQTFNQDKRDMINRAKKNWDDTKAQKPVVYGILALGSFVFTFGVKPYNIFATSDFSTGFVGLLLFLFVALAIFWAEQRHARRRLPQPATPK
ncbi:MAG: hypothetical protein ACLQU4_11070 [Limisphaerales bacterium]